MEWIWLLWERDGDVLKPESADGCAALSVYPKSLNCILGLWCKNYTSVGQLLKDYLETGKNLNVQSNRSRSPVVYAKL